MAGRIYAWARRSAAQCERNSFFRAELSTGADVVRTPFLHCAAEPVVGEICAAYFENPQARERIRTHIPNCKIICTLRDPVERLYSYYKLMRHNGRTELPFEEALVRHNQMMASSRLRASLFVIGRWTSAVEMFSLFSMMISRQIHRLT